MARPDYEDSIVGHENDADDVQSAAGSIGTVQFSGNSERGSSLGIVSERKNVGMLFAELHIASEAEAED